MEALEWSARRGISSCCHTLPALKAGFIDYRNDKPHVLEGERKFEQNRKGGSIFALPFDLGFHQSPTECTWTLWCYRFQGKLLILKLKFQPCTISLYGLSSHFSGLARCLYISIMLHGEAVAHSVNKYLLNMHHMPHTARVLGIRWQRDKYKYRPLHEAYFTLQWGSQEIK